MQLHELHALDVQLPSLFEAKVSMPAVVAGKLTGLVFLRSWFQLSTVRMHAELCEVRYSVQEGFVERSLKAGQTIRVGWA